MTHSLNLSTSTTTHHPATTSIRPSNARTEIDDDDDVISTPTESDDRVVGLSYLRSIARHLRHTFRGRYDNTSTMNQRIGHLATVMARMQWNELSNI